MINCFFVYFPNQALLDSRVDSETEKQINKSLMSVQSKNQWNDLVRPMWDTGIRPRYEEVYTQIYVYTYIKQNATIPALIVAFQC